MVVVAVEKDGSNATTTITTDTSLLAGGESSSCHEQQHDAGRRDSCGNLSAGGAVVAGATLSLMQPEALLPPPFPSNKPFRMYVSNMSVLPGHRRCGLARRLLQQCERIGERAFRCGAVMEEGTRTM